VSAVTVRRNGAAAITLIAAALALLGLPGSTWAAEVQSQSAAPHLHDADLEAEIDPLGFATSCRAEYVSAADFAAEGWIRAQSVPCTPAELPAVSGAQAVAATISSLAIDTEYHYRFVATSQGESKAGGDQTFHTFGIRTFSFEAVDAEGKPDTRGGAAPYELVTKVALRTGEVNGLEAATGVIKDLLTELPPGLIGNPLATERCPVRLTEAFECSGNAQVGMIIIESTGGVAANATLENAIYNTVAPQGSAARLAGQVNLSTNAYIDAGVRTGGDYGVTAGGFNIPTISNPISVEVRLWGVPADPRHDPERRCPTSSNHETIEGCSSTLPPRPFLRNPTACGGPLSATARVDAYQGPGEFVQRQAAMPAITGCDQLEFAPTIEARPTSDVADSPTGFHVDLHVPQSEDAAGLATADLKDAVVKLPPGLTVNPSSANGLEACTPGQFGLTTPVGVTPVHTTAAPATCPDAAKIGSVEVDTPLLDHPLLGAVYVAQPFQNPFNTLLAIYIAVDDPVSGVVIKLAGRVDVGAEGQLTTTFAANPQLPFDDFKLDFFGGDRAALKTPVVCGRYSTSSTLTPWSAPASGPPATPGNSYSVSAAPGGGSCPTSAGGVPISPQFEAGSESPLAGAFSPFVVRLTRPDGSQQFSSVTVTPPPGLLGSLAGIPYCPDAALASAAAKSGTEERAAPSCPASSQVGTVVAGAGAGPAPYYVAGKVYHAGPYKGAPLSLAIVTPAVAGPYDLGDVVVRSALEVNPETTQITVKSDPIPSELKGIPLDIRSIAVRMDRSNFTLNPTSCESMAVGGSVTTVQGGTAPLTNRFQVGSCAKLPFKPKLSLRVFGKTNRNSKPRFRAVLQMKPGEANIARAQVNLPHSEFLEQAHIKTICTRVQFAASACPEGSIYGRARAVSPLLEKPLEGPVYLRSSSHQLPDLVAALNGQIDVDLVGKTDSGPNEGLRNTFEVVPDAPVSKFVLELRGGGKGLLVNSEDLCSKRAKTRAIVRFEAHNGKVLDFKPHVRNSCSRPHPRKRRGG
jgi:hypothetical protein